MKDLPDLALLARTGSFESAQLRLALERTFEFRATHELPSALPLPPAAWTDPYVRLAQQDDLPWKTLEEVSAAVRAFLDPVLTDAKGTWSPAASDWEQ